MKKFLVTAVKLAVTVSILFLIFKKFQIGWGDIAAAFAESKRTWFLASMGTQLAAIAFSILRWRVLLQAQHLALPWPRLVTTYLVGRFLGTFTPTGMGLEAYKAYDSARYSSRTAEAVTVVLVEKCLTLLALCLLAIVSLAVIGLNAFFVAVFSAFLVGIFVVLLMLMYRADVLDRVARALPLYARTSGPIGKAVAAFDRFRGKKGAMGVAVVYAMCVYFWLFATFYTNGVALGMGRAQPGQAYALPVEARAVLTAMKLEHRIVGADAAQTAEAFLTDSERDLLAARGYELARADNKSIRKGLGMRDVMIVGPLTQLATMIPLSIAGIGLREGAFVGLLKQQGVWVGPRIVLAASMWYFVSVSVNILGAFLFMLRRTDYRAMRQQSR